MGISDKAKGFYKGDLSGELNKEEKPEIVLFVSFDIVNSSRYKTTNYSNWFKVIYMILQDITLIVGKKIKQAQLWRTIGDELIFVVKISNKEILKESIQTIFEILTDINFSIKSGKMFEYKGFNSQEKDYLIENNILEIKSACWIARVCNIKTVEEINDSIKGSIMYKYFIPSSEPSREFIEFQGNDIDIGFRVAKANTRGRRLALSIELAYMLSKDNSINPKLHIIGFNRLKGIWDNKLYPVIWYHDEYKAEVKLENSFHYDEDENDDLIQEYFKREESTKIRDKKIGNTNLELEKVIRDRNLLFKISDMEKMLQEGAIGSSKLIEEKGDTNLEVHCVAVCFNPKNCRILMFKRNEDDSKYSNKWDFGCSKMSRGISFKDQLVQSYRNFSKVEIIVREPFKEYNFNKNGVLISGIRFIAEVVDDTKLDVSNKYYLHKYMNLKEFRKIPPDKHDEYVEYSQFLEIFEYIYDKKEVE